MCHVAPGSDHWLALQRLRSQKVPEARRKQWLKALRWYKRFGYEEFCFDFICEQSAPQAILMLAHSVHCVLGCLTAMYHRCQ